MPKTPGGKSTLRQHSPPSGWAYVYRSKNKTSITSKHFRLTKAAQTV